MNADAQLEERLSRLADGEPPADGDAGAWQRALGDPPAQRTVRKWVAFEHLLRALLQRPSRERVAAGKARLLARAASEARRRPANLVAAGVVTAIFVVLCWALWTAGAYPAASLRGDARFAAGAAGPDAPRVVRSGAGRGTVLLGGYARIELAPDSAVALAGAPRAEVAELRRGGLTASLDRSGGSLTVLAPGGSAVLRGDARVRVTLRPAGETPADETADDPGERVTVTVLAGEVTVRDAWGYATLGPGAIRVLGAPPPGR